ncbi:MAG: ATP-binding cassette domain-containing protein, partial [Hyphomicrobiales bacterium]|nr:ATP-binding cassette domain-containing protein [Hyphomicrobiales bacterium]
MDSTQVQLHVLQTSRRFSTVEKRDQVDGARSREAALESERLSRVVGEKVLVNEISVQVQVGEVLAVVGPSGSGKTSFLRLLNRLDEPTGGIVRFNGRDYRELAPPELRRRIGMVMQAAFLFPGTVADNVAYGPRQRGQALAGEQIAVLLQRVGLPGYQERDVSNLSGGEAQRVSIARTLADDPEILLLDEPTSALDEDSARIGQRPRCQPHEHLATCFSGSGLRAPRPLRGGSRRACGLSGKAA